MCYFLYIASPLTLTEVRSMLPAGTTAELASPSDQRKLKSLHPGAQTVARLLVGRCSCDVIRPRAPDPREDERHLRQRYRSLHVARAQVIESLERHRTRGSLAPAAHSHWPELLAGFVVEHARNAGPTLYLLFFGSEPLIPPGHHQLYRLDTAVVRQTPRQWLAEGTPTLVC